MNYEKVRRKLDLKAIYGLMLSKMGIRLRQGKMRIPEGYFLLIFLLVLLNLDRLKVLLDLPGGSFRGKGNYHDTDG